ncbi:DUF3619 family protein [Thiohalobacter sp. IOR34]|uniref:DUF3619 family protein n=1 Tax=Thiohalobacter sp. IOR34 TaxID=3057176 RepID=UPI0025B134B3|nr:DUF3619 family protein [Thiohalobacter sp. IOR34]WJW75671.1 DUF3619 family protein [Thiohalobacter sp. IOR34]
MKDGDEAFARRLRQQLEAGLGQLDVPTRARLAAARRSALEGRSRRWRAPLGLALAASLLLALSILLLRAGGGAAPVVEDIELLVSGEDIEFYEELDFYDWLAAQPGDAGRAVPLPGQPAAWRRHAPARG